MPATGLLALIDDITTLMDDVAAMSKVAASKTMGIAGDDLAVNAQGLVGLAPSRELPILGKVAAGSVINKFVLVPLALLLPTSAIAPILMAGGTFLCFEGVHKILPHGDEHDHHDPAHGPADVTTAAMSGAEALAALEATKVKQALLTDVILSTEIVAVALSAVSDLPMLTRAITLMLVALFMTAFIYGIVAVLVKLDDIGLHLETTREKGSTMARFGRLLIDGTPVLMKWISIGGTFAMFLVGGGILVHNVPALAELAHELEHWLDHHAKPVAGVVEAGFTLVVGLVLGAVAVAVEKAAKAVIGAVRG